MKELFLSKLFHIGLFLIFGAGLFSMFDETYVILRGIISFIGFVMMIAGAFRNGFKF